MPELNLICTDDTDGTVTTKEFHSTYLPDAVEKIEDFLHGVGFVFDSLDLVIDKSKPVVKKDANLDAPDTILKMYAKQLEKDQ